MWDVFKINGSRLFRMPVGVCLAQVFCFGFLLPPHNPLWGLLYVKKQHVIWVRMDLCYFLILVFNSSHTSIPPLPKGLDATWRSESIFPGLAAA